MKILSLALVLSLFPAGWARAGDEKEQFEDLLRVARAEMRLGLTRQAVEKYEAALDLSVDDREKACALHELALVYTDDLADTASALDCYLRIVEKFEDEREGEALFRVGRILEESGRCHDAVGYYERVAVDYPETEYAELSVSGSERCFQRNFDEVSAVVAGEPITALELESAIERLPPVYRARYSSPEGKREYLDRMIRDRIVERFARENGYLDDPLVREAVRDARLKILNEQFFLREVRDRVEVTEEEIETFYEEHKDEYLKPVEIRVRHILLETGEEAREILDLLARGERFEDLANDYSIDMRTNDRGGDLGFISKGRTVKEVEEAAFALEPGEVSDVVESRFGYHIIKVEEKKPERYRSLEEMKNLVVGELRRIKEEERSERLMEELQKRYGVRVFDDS